MSTRNMPTSRTSKSCKVLLSIPRSHVRTHSFIITDCFAKHQIDRSIPVESLIKCKMQDNLEFLQWSKRYWDQYFPGGDYDALARRKGSGAPSAAAAPPPTNARTSGAGVSAGARRGTTPTTASKGARPGGAPAASSAVIQENNQLKETIQGLERERDFYFSKLRDIELLLQQAVEADPELDKDEDGLIKHIQTILYSTEVSVSFRYCQWWEANYPFSGGVRDTTGSRRGRSG